MATAHNNPATTTPRATTTIPSAPARTAHLDRLDNTRITFIVDPDILLACEDQAKSQGLSVHAWFQQTCNDALRTYLGV